MSDKTRNYEQELASLMDNLAESVFEMSDDEVRAEMKENGDSTDALRNILRQAVKDCRQFEAVSSLTNRRFPCPGEEIRPEEQ